MVIGLVGFADSIVEWDNSIERAQFIDENGTRVFDFASLINSLGSALQASDAGHPVALFTPATIGQYERTGLWEPAGGRYARG